MYNVNLVGLKQGTLGLLSHTKYVRNSLVLPSTAANWRKNTIAWVSIIVIICFSNVRSVLSSLYRTEITLKSSLPHVIRFRLLKQLWISSGRSPGFG